MGKQRHISKSRSMTAKSETPLDEFLRVARTFSDEHYINSLVAELRRCYSENAALRSRLERAEKDAERYRWWRARYIGEGKSFDEQDDLVEEINDLDRSRFDTSTNDGWDMAIDDAARKEVSDG